MTQAPAASNGRAIPLVIRPETGRSPVQFLSPRFAGIGFLGPIPAFQSRAAHLRGVQFGVQTVSQMLRARRRWLLGSAARARSRPPAGDHTDPLAPDARRKSTACGTRRRNG